MDEDDDDILGASRRMREEVRRAQERSREVRREARDEILRARRALADANELLARSREVLGTASARIRFAPVRPPKRVLLVEDDAPCATSLGHALRVLGHHVEIAADPHAALAQDLAFRCQVALLDLGLPVMSGWKLGRRLRQQTAQPPHLIAVTGHAADRYRQMSDAVGFVHHLIKPVDVRRLDLLMRQLA